MQTVTLTPKAVPVGVQCPKCQATAFKSRWQTFADGTRHVRLDCSACGTFVRYAKQQPDAPEMKHEPRRPDAHKHELAVPPSSWHWLGMIRQADNVWKPVAYAATLGKVWDALLHYPGTGDLLAIPTRPALGKGEDDGA